MTAGMVVDGFAAGAEAACLQPSAIVRPLYESVRLRVVETWTSFT